MSRTASPRSIAFPADAPRNAPGAAAGQENFLTRWFQS